MPPKKLKALALAMLLTCGGGYYGYGYWNTDRHIERTDNAYVRGDIVAVATKVPGYVSEVAVKDNQPVAKGDLLFRITPTDYEARLAEAMAAREAARAARSSLDAQSKLQGALINEANAGVRAAEAEAERALRDRDRADNLVNGGWTTRQRHDNIVALESRARATLQQAKAGLAARQQRLGVLAAEAGRLDAAVEQATARLRLAEIALNDTEVRAPVSGVVGNLHVDAGQYARPGVPMLAIVPLHDVWIIANFKETQLEHMAVGNPVAVQIDAFGGKKLKGWIDSLAPASGAEFSLLPPDNATGNFVRIVQRIPIKITLDPESSTTTRLRPGMSARVRVDTRSNRTPPTDDEFEVTGATVVGASPDSDIAHRDE